MLFKALHDVKAISAFVVLFVSFSDEKILNSGNTSVLCNFIIIKYMGSVKYVWNIKICKT
jgi:hypothetical protein